MVYKSRRNQILRNKIFPYNFCFKYFMLFLFFILEKIIGRTRLNSLKDNRSIKIDSQTNLPLSMNISMCSIIGINIGTRLIYHQSLITFLLIHLSYHLCFYMCNITKKTKHKPQKNKPS